MSGLRVGDEAPDFTLPGVQDGEERTWTLSDLWGRPVVLVFYPGDGTPVCTRQLNAYTSDIGTFAEVGAQVLALSPQGIDSHRHFAEQERGFAFPLLADEGKAVAEAYGVLGPLGFYRRSVFVVDAAGRVAWSHRATAGLTYRPAAEIAAAVRAAGEATGRDPAA